MALCSKIEHRYSWTASGIGWGVTSSVVARRPAFLLSSPLSYIKAFLLDLSLEICYQPIDSNLSFTFLEIF